MAFIPVPNTASVEMVFLSHGQVVENRYHCEKAGPYDEPSMTSLAEVFRLWWLNEFQSNTPTTTSLEKIIVRALDNSYSPGIEYTSALPLIGTSTGSPQLPNNVTVAIKWTTGLRGRSFRGRTYHVGMKESEVVGNQLDTGIQAFLLAAYGQLLDDVAAEGAEMVVCSRVSNGSPRAAGLTTAITGVAVDPYVDSQRRRLSNRGR